MQDPLFHAARLRAYSDILVESGRDDEARGLRETADAIEASADIPDRPVRLGPPRRWELNVIRPDPPDFGRRQDWQSPYTRAEPISYSGEFEWDEGCTIQARPTMVIVRADIHPDGAIDAIVPIGGREFLVPLRRTRGNVDVTTNPVWSDR
jgi:hypothetical protein